MEDRNLKEKDFQRYVGWKIPLIIWIVWTLLFIWGGIYFVTYLIPDLGHWLDR